PCVPSSFSSPLSPPSCCRAGRHLRSLRCLQVLAGGLLVLLDPKCANAADCLSRCPPSAQSGCSRECTASAVYANLTACSSQCVSTGVADVISLVAPARADNIMAGCNAMKKAMCATAIAGAIVACGGPEDIPCILAALGALEGCVTCFCESKGCRGLCKHVC
ncbi:uncharacterized protein ACA1_116680, partial [Acanthamoeba castellanii str. Neff]